MRKRYDNDFKLMIVELVNSGQSAKSVSQEYSVDYNNVVRWRREYKAKSGDFNKKRERSPEELEIKRLKKALRDAEEERDILKKAVSIFSKSDK